MQAKSQQQLQCLEWLNPSGWVYSTLYIVRSPAVMQCFLQGLQGLQGLRTGVGPRLGIRPVACSG